MVLFIFLETCAIRTDALDFDYYFKKCILDVLSGCDKRKQEMLQSFKTDLIHKKTPITTTTGPSVKVMKRIIQTLYLELQVDLAPPRYRVNIKAGNKRYPESLVWIVI